MLKRINAAWEARVEDWVDRHHPRVPGSRFVNRRRIYILPSRAGWGFGLLALVVLLAAMNYSNALGYYLAFWLGALGFVVMHETHANMLGTEIYLAPPPPVFVGERARQPVHIKNHSRRTRMALCVDRDRLGETDPELCDSVDESVVPLHWRPHHRGVHQPPRFSVSSDYPLGLFRAWTWVHLEMTQLVYPRPAPPGVAPPTYSDDPSGEMMTERGQDELVGLRAYAQGDNPRHIHWRSFAAYDQLATKNFADPRSELLWLDLASLERIPDLESRLSQLCRWVLDLHDSRRHFGMRLGEQMIPPGRGEHHRDRCLEALARYGHDN